jgi:hypothetical protein
MGGFRTFWLYWGAFVMMSTNVVLFLFAASPAYRRRATAGGRSPFGFLVLFPSAAIATAIGVGTSANPFPWVFLTGITPLFAFSEVRRRRLATAPASDLSPALRAWRDEVPGLGELVRHPVASTVANFRFLAKQVTARRDDKQWERDNGLR